MKPIKISLILAAGLSGAAALAEMPDITAMDAEAMMTYRPSSLELAAAGRRYNPEAPIPPQCYTRIESKYNPCYVCHQNNADGTRPNFMQDGSLQEAYFFSDTAMVNHHRNLFIDRTDQVAAISDQEILDYINTDNYSGLADRLRAQGFKGYIPDIEGYQNAAEAFDATGHAKDGSGWVAFNYKPQPSTFWPTNGSTDDVIIRLAEEYRTKADGTPSRDVYTANLALVEITMQDYDRVTLPPVDEAEIGVDIDGDGTLGTATEILRRDTYLGAASDVALVRMMYPLGTEFLHSVRYVGLEGDEIVVPPRMKELRYMVKTRMLTIPELRSRYGNENQEKVDENLPRYIDLGDRGMDSGFAWTLLGFIEDADGDLRKQTNEETFFCRGCHATTGANIDQTWAFPRKVKGAEGWGYIDTHGMSDAPNKGGDEGEILTYFKRVGGGDEFRSNLEMMDRWFNEDGSVKEEAVKAASVYELITPSRERALEMNKAYRVIVGEQSFIYGRDATTTPPINVLSNVDDARGATLDPEYRYEHDIRLTWD